MSTERSNNHPASFRDPSGFIFIDNQRIYRAVENGFKHEYDSFMQSGLYETLTTQNILVQHEEVLHPKQPGTYKTLKPEVVPFISYPYEWSFSQLKSAALTTLKIQLLALEHGQSLKDASAFNIQFMNGKAIFIDTLSFETYKEGAPWVAYKQFCQHFLAPLALMTYVDLRFGSMSKDFIDGIPLDLTAKLLPAKSKFQIGIATHIHLHAKSQNNHANDAAKSTIRKDHRGLSKNNLIGILKNLESTVLGLSLPKQKTEWGSYYEDTNYSEAGQTFKKDTILSWIQKIKPVSVWDAGANDAKFSSLASLQGIFTVATDIDPIAVENAYRRTQMVNDTHLLPLVIDLTNPSPGIGWKNEERTSFLFRSNFQLTMALALVHHLAISNNLPFTYIAKMFSEHSENVIIEFVPKSDSNTKRLLATREDIFPDYNEAGFENAFTSYFKITEKISIPDSTRILYLLKKK